MKNIPADKAVLTGSPIRAELAQGSRLAGLNIGWHNEGPLSWTLPYTVRDIVVYGTDGLPLQQQPVRIIYDQEKSNVMPGAGFRESRETLLTDYAGHGAELVELPASFSTFSPNLSAGNGAELRLHIPTENGSWRLSRIVGGLPSKKSTVWIFGTVSSADRIREVPDEWTDRKNEH